jgi:AcrR family transcriptional regulator
MSRMLDAGEELYLQGGSNQLKLNLIIEKSGSSTGSFYARFGDMQGYLDALHERALARIAAELAPAIEKASLKTNVPDIIATFVEELVKVLAKFQSTIYFFAVASSQAPLTRPRGSKQTLDTQAALANILKPHLINPSSVETQRRLEMTTRLITAMSFQTIMFEHKEVSSLKLNTKEFVEDLTAVLVQGLSPIIRQK